MWELFFTNMPADAKRIATDRVKWSVKYQKKIRHRQRAGEGPAGGRARAHPARLQARVYRSARTERLRAHRSAARRGGQRLGARGESEPADCEGRGLRGVSRKGRYRLRLAAAADSSIWDYGGSPRASRKHARRRSQCAATGSERQRIRRTDGTTRRRRDRRAPPSTIGDDEDQSGQAERERRSTKGSQSTAA